MQKHHLEECAEDDGMRPLRDQVHAIHRMHGTHEARAKALLELMRQKPEVGGNTISASSANSKGKVPEALAVAPQLEALPVEIIENVVQHLTASQFGNFRLAGQWLHRKSLHYYAKTFFTKQTMTLEWSSMRRLALIHAHEIFGPLLKDLVILLEGQSFLPHQPPPQYGMAASRRRISSGAHISTVTTQGKNHAKQIELMLVRILERIPVLRSVVIGIRSRSIYPEIGTKLPLSALSIIFTSIALGGTRIQSLVLGGRGELQLTRPSFIRGDGSEINFRHTLDSVLVDEASSLKRALLPLKHLDLVWSIGARQATIFPHSSGTFVNNDFPNTLLKLTPHLEKLVLHDYEEMLDPRWLRDRPPYLNYISVPLPQLKSVELHLNLEDFDVPSIKRFVREVCGNIQQLSLHPLEIFTAAQADTLAQRLRAELGVVEIQVTSMMDNLDSEAEN